MRVLSNLGRTKLQQLAKLKTSAIRFLNTGKKKDEKVDNFLQSFRVFFKKRPNELVVIHNLVL